MASSSALTMTSSSPEIIHCGIPHPPTSTQTLPPELILQILLHLPVTQIVRQKLVSKTWNRNLIGPEERRFISHFHPHAHGLLFRTYSESLFVANLDSLPLRRRNPDPAADVDPSVANLDYLPIPVPVRRLIGFSRGVLCVESHHDHRLRFYDVFSSTRTPTPMRALPHYSSSSCPASYEGFGYDSRARDYKFVRVTWESRVTRESSWRVEVYRLKSDCWEEFRFCPLRRYDFRAGNVGVFANGCLHWLVTTTEEEGEEGEGKEGEEEGKEEEVLGQQMEEEEEEEEEAEEEGAAAAEENLVLKYDLHEGEFREVALPRHQVLRRADLKNTGSSSSSSKAAGLIYLCGNLCLWAAFKNFGIWVLTELSEKKPWARLCRFRYKEHNIWNPYPVAFLHRQRRILINGFCDGDDDDDGDGDGDNGKVVEKQLLYCLDSCRVFPVDSHEVIRDLVQSTTTTTTTKTPPAPQEEEKRGISIDGVVGSCVGLALSFVVIVSFSVCSRLCSLHQPRARSMC